MTFKTVDEATFHAFIDGYHKRLRPLRREYQRIGDPPSTLFYDSETREVVASMIHHRGPGETTEFRIRC